ncbi:MAG: hypothetical protein K2H97_10835 [Prevotella sp.]|nr:hypothetical protein [Prevotella sp.]
MLFALVLMVLGAMNVSAEEISLKDIPYWFHAKVGGGPWGLQIEKKTQITPGEEGCFWEVGVPSAQPYGDSDVSSFADLSDFEKLIITFTEGEPRVLMNRDADDGQFDDNEEKSHLIDNTRGGWCSKYFSTEGGVMTVDLKQMVNDKGFAHLNAIKAKGWGNTMTVESMVVTRKAVKQVGWINILTNSDMEGTDVSSFPVVTQGGVDGESGGTEDATIVDGAGVDGSRGLVLNAMQDAPQGWTTQLFVKLPEVLAAGTKWRFSMDVMSDPGTTVGGGIHAAPRSWIGGAIIPEFTTSPSWTTITGEGEITQEQFEKGFQSIAFDLNNDKVAIEYHFDNIKFEIYKYGTTAEFQDDNVQVDFGFQTNIPELCKAAGKNRVLFPNETATVKVNGKEVGITSVEGFADGRFYIFLDEAAEPSDEVQVIFTNPAGELQLVYAGGPNAGQAIPAVDEIADYNGDLTNVETNDVFPYTMLPPTVVSAKPEQGSFNIAPDLKVFTAKFDKKADASRIVAKLDGTALTVAPAEGLVEEITMTYAGADMANGNHTINISKIYPEDDALGEDVYTDTTYVFSVGAPDATDVPYDLIPLSYFESCGVNSVPEGFLLIADGGEERIPGGGYGSGARVMEFGAGGDFTRGLYMRTYYVTYGTPSTEASTAGDENHQLNMTAGKKYNISFNSCQWAGAGQYMKFQITKDGEEVYSKVVENKPALGESRNAVTGSTLTSIDFIPETDGNYVMNWIVVKDAEGTPTENDWTNGVILANVKVSYIPASFGTVETLAVTEALEKAKKTLEGLADERYDGAAQTALSEAIAKVEAEQNTYTSPSECNEAIALLTKTSDDLKNHAALCNNYDQLIKDGSDVVRQNANNKFSGLELYAQLKTVVDKYHGVSVMQNDGTEEEPNWQKHYTYDVLKDDVLLNTAIEELTAVVNETKNMFTTGVPKMETTGVAALVERLRLGAEGLKALGVAEDDALVVRALNAIDDDDELAEAVKIRTKAVLYEQLKNTDNTLFAADENTGMTPEYEMTVFVKNPNMYSPAYSTEVPGWDNITGNAGAWSSWNGNLNHGKNSPYVQDCALHPGWHAVASTEQTIIDLPAGVYTIKIRANDNSETTDGTYAYVKTSETPEVEEGAELDKEYHYAGYADVAHSGWDLEINNITVTDGTLTLGCAWGPESQAFFDEFHVMLTAPAAGFDYAQAYADHIETGIENTQASQVKAIELYNLDGRRISSARQGIVIVKKIMSDGTVRTEKVVRK